MRRIHVVYIAEDGICSMTCGVGAIAEAFVGVFERLYLAMRQNGVLLRLSVVSLSTGKYGSRPDLLAKAQSVCSRHGGIVHLIDSDPHAMETYLSIPRWESYNARAREFIQGVRDASTDEVLVLANDTIFAHCFVEGTRHIWIPHSFQEVHGQSYVDASARIAWEDEALRTAAAHEEYYVGAIAPHVVTLLLKKGVENPSIILTQNGFDLDELALQRVKYQTMVEGMMDFRGLDMAKPKVLAFGRADEYKGLDVATGAMVEFLATRPNWLGVVIASRISDEDVVTNVQRRIYERASACDQLHTFFGYEFALPKALMCHSGTRALVHVPTRDFAPLVPQEAALLGHDELLVINSNLSCMNCSVWSHASSLLVEPSVDDTARALAQVAAMKGNQSRAIRSQARQRAVDEHDLVKNYTRAILRAI